MTLTFTRTMRQTMRDGERLSWNDLQVRGIRYRGREIIGISHLTREGRWAVVLGNGMAEIFPGELVEVSAEVDRCRTCGDFSFELRAARAEERGMLVCGWCRSILENGEHPRFYGADPRQPEGEAAKAFVRAHSVLPEERVWEFRHSIEQLAGGQFFGVTFERSDGSIRRMAAKLVRFESRSRIAARCGNLVVLDASLAARTGRREIRSFPIDRVKRLRVAGTEILCIKLDNFSNSH